MRKRRFTVTAVSSLGNKVDILEAALKDCHTKLLILILRNWGLLSTLKEEMESGIKDWA